MPARDRARLERLCRDVCRPPIAQERLLELAGGKLRYLLKSPGATARSPSSWSRSTLCARIAALIPPPRFHMIRYHAVLSSYAQLRSEVVPKVDDNGPKQLALLEHDRTVLASGVGSHGTMHGPGSSGMSSSPTSSPASDCGGVTR